MADFNLSLPGGFWVSANIIGALVLAFISGVIVRVILRRYRRRSRNSRIYRLLVHLGLIQTDGEEEEIPKIIQRCRTNLIIGREARSSAERLGDIALEHDNRKVVDALLEAVCKTHNLFAIIDHCAANIGRIVWEPLEPPSEIEDYCFEIFAMGTNTCSEPIIEKFAYTVGEVCLNTMNKNNRIMQLAWDFIDAKASSQIPLVRYNYTYTKKRIREYLNSISN